MSSRYSIIPQLALMDKRLSPIDIKVLLLVSAYDERGCCRLSFDQMGEIAGIDSNEVMKSIRNLLLSGYLKECEDGYTVLMDCNPPREALR